jgi:type IV pilus assembly protein PilA
MTVGMEPRRRGASVFSAAGFTLIEVLVVVAIVGVLAAMAIGQYNKAKMAANEASAIGTLRTLNSAQMAYSSTCGKNSYSPTIARLVTGGYASPDMDVTPKSGYNFTLTAGTGNAGAADCNGEATQTAYYASGEPVAGHGRRGFATSVGGTIWEDYTGVPPAQPFTTGATRGPLK